MAILAFPVIYYVIGLPVGLFVGDYYRQEAFGLVLPSIDVLIGVQLLRTALYLLASLPIAIAWSGSRNPFILVFGIAFFVLTGLYGMAQAYRLPEPGLVGEEYFLTRGHFRQEVGSVAVLVPICHRCAIR